MRTLLIALALTAGCGDDATPTNDPSSPSTGEEAVASDEGYDLHEWGLVSVRGESWELAAGPGQRVVMAIDKPVLYVHASEAFDLSVDVHFGNGIALAEHFPPVDGTPNRVGWQARVNPSPCTEARNYPRSCDTLDGYCETTELPLYETTDAACLEVGEQQWPLLFYRLRGEAPPSLPIAVERNGDAITVRNESWRGVGKMWRVRFVDGQTRVASFDVPAVGASATVPDVAENPASARAALRADLGTIGLTDPETEAFMRAWDEALFGARTTDARSDGDDGTPSDVLPADSPVPVPTDEETPMDRTSIDELGVDDLPSLQGGPRVPDVLLYWLPDADTERLARIEAQPAPRHLRRAILVRHAL